MVGGPGAAAGVTLADAAEGTLLPSALMATTRQVTGTPLTSPITVIGDPIAFALCMPQVAVKPVMAEPPLLAGAEKATVTCASPGVTVPMVGAPGAPAGVTLLDAADGMLLPTALVAVTEQVTATPLASPMTMIGDPAPPALCAPQLAV